MTDHVQYDVAPLSVRELKDLVAKVVGLMVGNKVGALVAHKCLFGRATTICDNS